jgi:hypothetical protein
MNNRKGLLQLVIKSARYLIAQVINNRTLLAASFGAVP